MIYKNFRNNYTGAYGTEKAYVKSWKHLLDNEYLINDEAGLRANTKFLSLGPVRLVCPTTVKKIADSGFRGCNNLQHIALTESCEEIEQFAFVGCFDLDPILLFNKKCVVGAAIGVDTKMTNTSIEMDAGVYIGEYFIGWEEAVDTGFISVKNDMITGVNPLFHETCNLLVIPSVIKGIKNAAFGYCSKLTRVKLLGSMDTVESWAFVCCTNLTKFDSDKVKNLALDAFEGCTSFEK